jgi:hypothetical protein
MRVFSCQAALQMLAIAPAIAALCAEPGTKNHRFYLPSPLPSTPLVSQFEKLR